MLNFIQVHYRGDLTGMTSNGNNNSYNGGYEALVVYQTASCIYAHTHRNRSQSASRPPAKDKN